jgi:mycofactocin precursor
MIAPARQEVLLMTGENAAAEATPETEDVEEAEELLVEEISIDGMCGVY